MQSSIQFHTADKAVTLTARKRLKAFIRAKFDQESIPLAQLVYIFCSDDYLLDINLRFLNHNYLTDIITFPLQEVGEPVNGEIYISVDRVKENATSLKVSPANELLRVIFHGALHLLGYKDKNKEQAQAMRTMENKWLTEYERFHVEQ